MVLTEVIGFSAPFTLLVLIVPSGVVGVKLFLSQSLPFPVETGLGCRLGAGRRPAPSCHRRGGDISTSFKRSLFMIVSVNGLTQTAKGGSIDHVSKTKPPRGGNLRGHGQEKEFLT